MLPNPIPSPITEKRPPTADEVKARREYAKHTQIQAADLIYVTDRAWRYWELGKREMPLGLYELYCIKTTGYMKMPWHE